MLLCITFVTRFLMKGKIMRKITKEIFERLCGVEMFTDALEMRIEKLEKLEKQNKTAKTTKKKAVKKNEK
jgi:hypothetical protein